MTPKLSNLDIPEIKSAAAEWALVSSQIEKITLHRFKPGRISTTDKGPFYAIFIWVSVEVDLTIMPWKKNVKDPDGKRTRVELRKLYREKKCGIDDKGRGVINSRKIRQHPLYGLWNLINDLSDPIGRGYFDSFYRDGFERTDPRFDWLVLLLNAGEETVFDPGQLYDNLDNTEIGSAVLFSRNAIASQNDETAPEKSKTWYSGRDIITEKGITIYELFELMKKGLQAHTVTHDLVVDCDYLLPVQRKLMAEIRTEMRLDSAKPYARPISELSELEKKYMLQCRYDDITGGLFSHPKGYALMSFSEILNDSCSKVWDFQYKAVDVEKFMNEANQDHPLPSYEEIKKAKERRAWDLVKDRGISQEIQNETYELLIERELQIEMFENRAKNLADFEKNQKGTADEETQAEAVDSLLCWALDNRQLIADLADAEGTQNKPTDPSALSKVNRLDITKEPQQTQGVPANQSATPNSSTPDRAVSIEQTDPEAFIRSLQVFHVDNTTIKIQYKRKSTDYTCKSIGFRDSKTKAWVTFLEILQSKDHFYKLGPANYYDEGLRKKVPVKEYSRRKALLKEIKKKLLYFLSKQYGVVFPPRVKLYELQPTQGDGVYLFLFQIPLDKPSYKTKDQALRLLETLIQEEASNEKIQQASETAMDAGATQVEVFEIVKDRLTSPQKYSETADEPEDGDEDKEE